MALADALGNLTGCRRLPGKAHDLRCPWEPIEGLTRGQFLAGRAFDANRLRTARIEPPLSGRVRPRHLQVAAPDRELLWQFKDYRGTAMRCCKTDESFSAFIALAATVIRSK